jgi:hypothetical protein
VDARVLIPDLEPVGIDSKLIAYNVNKHVINIMLFRKGLKEWAQSGDSERLSYLFSCTLVGCKFGCQSKLVWIIGGVTNAS